MSGFAALIVAAAKATKEKEEEEERAAKAAEEAKKNPLERLHAPSIVPSLFSDSENPLATYFDVAVIRYVNEWTTKTEKQNNLHLFPTTYSSFDRLL